MDDDLERWMVESPRTESELAEMRAKSVKDEATFGRHTVDSFTCDDCELRFRCLLVFDGYSTGGECLLDK